MYENLIQQPPLSKSRNPFSVRLAEIPVHEKAVYVHSVCAALIDSRFGMGRSKPLVTQLSDRPELEDAVFWEVSDRYKAPVYTMLSDSERVRREVTEIFMFELERAAILAADARLQTRSPQTQGRGSPKISQGRTDGLHPRRDKDNSPG